MAKKERAKRKVVGIKALPKGSKKVEALEKLREVYNEQINDATGLLHNKIIAFISEARLPLTNVIMVLDIVREEAIELARQKYFKEK